MLIGLHRFYFFIVLGSILTFTSCGRNRKCGGGNENKGLILQSASISCSTITGKDRFRIDSDSVYKQTFDSTCALPQIDFRTNTLLGLYASGGCEVKFIREVKKTASSIEYRVKVNECGICKKLGFSFNWVLVPKLSASDEVTFVVN
jgi:hypothetical protein